MFVILEYHVTIFSEVLDRIFMLSTENVNTDEGDTADKLLSAPVLNYTITHKDVVSSVSI